MYLSERSCFYYENSNNCVPLRGALFLSSPRRLNRNWVFYKCCQRYMKSQLDKVSSTCVAVARHTVYTVYILYTVYTVYIVYTVYTALLAN